MQFKTQLMAAKRLTIAAFHRRLTPLGLVLGVGKGQGRTAGSTSTYSYKAFFLP